MKVNENMYSSFYYSTHLQQFNVPSDKKKLSSFFFHFEEIGQLWIIMETTYKNFITSTLLFKKKKSRNLEKHKVDMNLLGVIKRVTQSCNKYEGVTK